MLLYFRLAWRNIWRHRRRTVIVVLAIALGLSLMMFYDGLLEGFDQAIYGNAIKVLGGNIQIHANGYSDKSDQMPLIPLPDDAFVLQTVRKLPQVVSASRRIKTGGLATNREGAFSVQIDGIEPEEELKVNLAAEHVISGRYLTANDADVTFIGKGLADAMAVKVGDRISVTGRATHDQMRKRTFTVIGIYDLGLADIEKRSIFISLAEAQNLYGLEGKSTEVVVSLKQLGQESQVINALKPNLPGYELQSYDTSFPELKAAIGSKNGVMEIFSIIIMVVAGIGIMNMLLMAIYERTREIGILGAFGMKPNQISILFIIEGIFMGFVGVIAGIVLGLAINGVIKVVGLDFSTYSSMTSYMALISGKIYPSWGTSKIVFRSVTVLIISALAAFYPAREAAHREPAEALHYV